MSGQGNHGRLHEGAGSVAELVGRGRTVDSVPMFAAGAGAGGYNGGRGVPFVHPTKGSGSPCHGEVWALKDAAPAPAPEPTPAPEPEQPRRPGSARSARGPTPQGWRAAVRRATTVCAMEVLSATGRTDGVTVPGPHRVFSYGSNGVVQLRQRLARPAQYRFRVSPCAARTLSATDQSRVTLSRR